MYHALLIHDVLLRCSSPNALRSIFSRLADTFKRPLVWSDYCTRISPNNCTAPDDVAARAPSDAAEGGKYFVRGEYTGHFVATEKNNCTANPDCTGHIIDYPCTWSAYTASQLYWNDISLESNTPNGMNSYAYAATAQILEASFATNRWVAVVRLPSYTADGVSTNVCAPFLRLPVPRAL